MFYKSQFLVLQKGSIVHDLHWIMKFWQETIGFEKLVACKKLGKVEGAQNRKIEETKDES